MTKKHKHATLNVSKSTWLNKNKVSDSALSAYQKSLFDSCPNHIVIDNLFDDVKLTEVMLALKQSDNWLTQKHTYSALYVDDNQWKNTHKNQRFVQRDLWDRDQHSQKSQGTALDFLSYLRGDEFMSILSQIFNVSLTDIHVKDPDINTNYFRISAKDFVEQHADDSPGREVCMLLYLNKNWKKHSKTGGELVFIGDTEKPIQIPPVYNRCVLFNPSSKGSEHWVEKLNTECTNAYRYNVTSWYWSE